jgi:hypothetical protein
MIRSSENLEFLTSNLIKDLPGRVYFMTSLWLICYPGTPIIRFAAGFREVCILFLDPVEHTVGLDMKLILTLKLIKQRKRNNSY